MKFNLGCDPEWFVTNGKKPISIIGKIGGTKDEPISLPELGDRRFAVQEDNVALEYNTPPTDSHELWLHQHTVMAEYLKERLKGMGLKPLIKGSVIFDDQELNDQRAWIFGCDPDFNAWTGRINPKPFSENPNLRSAGGHIHIGTKYAKMTKLQKIMLVRQLDLCVGLPLMLVDPDVDRQQLYGKAGAFRFKEYGIEYRTPSNYWTRTKSLVAWIARNAEHAFSRYQENRVVPDDVQVVLDEHDLPGAKTLLLQHGIPQAA